MLVGWYLFENHIDKMTEKLRLVLVVLVELSQLLSKLLISSLLLQTILPPNLGVLVKARSSTAVTLFVFYFCKSDHLLVKNFCRLSTKRYGCRANRSLLKGSALKSEILQLMTELVSY